jgi:adenylate cyclase
MPEIDPESAPSADLDPRPASTVQGQTVQDKTVQNPAFQDRPQLSSAISYYLRKLLRQNLDRLECQSPDPDQLRPDAASRSGTDSLIQSFSTDPHLILERLHPAPGDRAGVIAQLEALAHRHQRLASLQRSQDLRDTEQSLFSLLGLRLAQTMQAGTILVIDNSPDTLAFLTTALTQVGYEVRTTNNGTLALSRAQLITPDLILLDAEIPGMSSYEICRQLKADCRSDDIPILFISANSSVEMKVKAFTVGAADYILQPFQIEELLARIHTHLERSHLQRRIEEQNMRLQQEIQERQQAEERYRTFFAYTFDGVYQTGVDGRLINANPSMARILGYGSREALLDQMQYVSRIYVQPGRRREFMEQLHQHEVVSDFESLVHRRDGSTIPVLEAARTIRDGEGRVLFYEGFMRDLSELRAASAGWQRGRQRVHRLLLSIFPRAIAREYIQQEGSLAKRYDQVSLLLLDLSPFHRLAQTLSSEDLLDRLNALVLTLDQLVYRAGLERIHAAGDRYLVVSGLPTPHPKGAAAIADLALSIQEVLHQFEIDSSLAVPPLAIALHHGAVSAGVVGERKLSYQLWGESLQQLEAIASQAKPGLVNMSETMQQQLGLHYQAFPQGNILSQTGRLMTYRLDRRLVRYI